MNKYRVFYVAEVEAEDEKKARMHVLMNQDLLQYQRTEDITLAEELKLNWMEHWDILCDLFSLDKKAFMDIDESTINQIYCGDESVVCSASSACLGQDIVFYVYKDAYSWKVKVVKIAGDYSAAVISNFISMDCKK